MCVCGCGGCFSGVWMWLSPRYAGRGHQGDLGQPGAGRFGPGQPVDLQGNGTAKSRARLPLAEMCFLFVSPLLGLEGIYHC